MKQSRAGRPKLELVRGGRAKAEKPVQFAPWNPSDREDAEPGPRPKVERGVYEDVARFAGVRSFQIVDSSGECIRIVQEPARRVTDETEAELWRWLHEHDPITPPPALRLDGPA
jgi:hypothetical protein